MAIPDFQSITLPLLRHVSDGQEYAISATRGTIADEFGLTVEERNELLPSGKQSRFNNRVAWAKVYLERAGLLGKTRRGYFRITDAGRRVVAAPPDRIDIAFLRQFQGFDEFRSPVANTSTVPTETNETPEESLETAYATLRSELAAVLLAQVKSASPQFFERLVVDLMVKLGYGGSEKVASITAPGADEGIDGIINEDRLGLDIIYLQAKRWEGNVGRPELQKFVGALHGQRAKKGVFLTTSQFTQDAVSYVKTIDPKVVLIDGKRLAELMIEYDVGVSLSHNYALKRIDSDYFIEE